MLSTSKANGNQVGGGHYRKSIQHWDFVAANGWGYFEAQASKYLCRWRDKHPTREGKLTDLGKSVHFLEKLLELAEVGAACPVQTHTRHPVAEWLSKLRYKLGFPPAQEVLPVGLEPVSLDDFVDAQDLGPFEHHIIGMLSLWTETGHMPYLRESAQLARELYARQTAGLPEDPAG